MVIEKKVQGELSHTSLSDAPGNREVTASEVSVKFTAGELSDNSSDIFYRPPETISNMNPSTRSETTSLPTLSNADTSTMPGATATASYDPLSSSSRSDINGAASNISKRKYIYFLPYPLPPGTVVPYSIHLPQKNPLNLPSRQFEPTKTLVLTSPLRTFVDIRMYKPFTTSSTSPNQGSPQGLEWAFAGTSASVPKQDTGGDGWDSVTHCTWTHWLDSRFSVGDTNIPVDEGDMYHLSDTLSLEVGHAFHPALGAVKTHEEMWGDEQVKATTKQGTKICAVLRCHDEAAKVRGVVVRVGQYVQGLLMQGAATTAERWEWLEKKNEGDEEAGTWQRTVRVGDGFLPCAVCFREAILVVGGRVGFHGLDWVVEEVWEWA